MMYFPIGLWGNTFSRHRYNTDKTEDSNRTFPQCAQQMKSMRWLDPK